MNTFVSNSRKYECDNDKDIITGKSGKYELKRTLLSHNKQDSGVCTE